VFRIIAVVSQQARFQTLFCGPQRGVCFDPACSTWATFLATFFIILCRQLSYTATPDTHYDCNECNCPRSTGRVSLDGVSRSRYQRRNWPLSVTPRPQSRYPRREVHEVSYGATAIWKKRRTFYKLDDPSISQAQTSCRPQICTRTARVQAER
jgi:hypothetical protein